MQLQQLSTTWAGVSFLALGLLFLFGRFFRAKNRAAQMIYDVYRRVTFGVSTDAYLLTGGVVLAAFGLALLMGLIA
jgi:hypothetical protein